MTHIDVDRFNRIGERVRRGEITHAKALQLAGGSPAAGPNITATGLDDHTLAARSLMHEYGVAELDARRAVAEVGLDAFRDRINTEAKRVIALKQADADSSFAQSPDGLIQAAEQKQLGQQQKARHVELAKVALEGGDLFSSDDLAALSADELLQAAGFVQREDAFRAGASDATLNRRAAGLDQPEGQAS